MTDTTTDSAQAASTSPTAALLNADDLRSIRKRVAIGRASGDDAEKLLAHIDTLTLGAKVVADAFEGIIEEAKSDPAAVLEAVRDLKRRVARFEQIVSFPQCGEHLSHAEVAGRVRMLMRYDLDHEAVCTMARDRIMWLANRVGELEVERDQTAGALTDPIAVLVNMKRGSIAVPSLRAMLDLHAGALERWDRAADPNEHGPRMTSFLPPDTMPKTPLTTSDDDNPSTPAALHEAGIAEPMQVGPWVIGWYDGPDGDDVQLIRWNDTLKQWETRCDFIVTTFKGWLPFDAEAAPCAIGSDHLLDLAATAAADVLWYDTLCSAMRVEGHLLPGDPEYIYDPNMSDAVYLACTSDIDAHNAMRSEFLKLSDGEQGRLLKRAIALGLFERRRAYLDAAAREDEAEAGGGRP